MLSTIIKSWKIKVFNNEALKTLIIMSMYFTPNSD